MQKRITPINDKAFGAARHMTNDHIANVPYETTLEDVLHPQFWSCVASRMRAGEFIKVLPEGMEWGAELIVVHATPISAQVKLWHHVVLTEAVKFQHDDYRIERDGRWWKVFRNADNVMIGKAQPSKEEAEEVLRATMAGV